MDHTKRSGGPGRTDEGDAEPEVLSLAPEAAELWRRVRSALDALCAGDEHGTAKTLTGDAVLAGRLGHRATDGVDVHLRRIASFEVLRTSRMHGQQLDDAMRKLGGTREYSCDLQIIYTFDAGKLDLIAGTLFPTPYGERAD